MEKRIEEILVKILKGTGIEIIDITVRGEKRNKVIEVFVDSVTSVDLERISELSRRFNEELEKDDIKKEILKFIISTPGVERPFKYIWQMKKFEGKFVEFDENGTKKKCVLNHVDVENGILELVEMKGKEKKNSYNMKFEDLKNIIISLPF